MAKDINNVTDDISLVMRELIDATENAIVLETAIQLHKGSKTNDPKEYVKKQNSNNREFNNKINKVVKKSQDIMFNVVDNVGTYTGTETSNLKKEINKGMKMVVASANNMKKDTIKSVSRLDRYRTSSQFIPDIDKSIIDTTKKGIDKGLPVTYKNGKKVSYKAYMEMAVRTGIQQEIGNRQLETGGQANIVFWLVNEFEDCADDHASYQGKIYYDERYNTFPLEDQIKSLIQDYIQTNGLLSIQAVRDKPPYLTTRPNCRHKMKPVGIDQVLQKSVEIIKDEVGYKTKSYRPENYEATKTQRYNERQIRGYKQKEQTFRELYNTTKNKEYLMEAQKAKRQTLFWQKRQRQHMENNPQLFRDYERETSKVLLQDLGLGKKIQVDPNLPPTPITNNPPQTPPKQDVPINETIKEHFEIPEQKIDMFLKPQDIVVDFSGTNEEWEKSEDRIKTFNSYNNFIEKNFIRSNDMVSVSLERLFKKQTQYMPKMKVEYTSGRPMYRTAYNRIEINSTKNKNETEIENNNQVILHEIGHSIDGNIGQEVFGTYKFNVTNAGVYVEETKKSDKNISKRLRIKFDEKRFEERMEKEYHSTIKTFNKLQKEIFEESLEYNKGVQKYVNKSIIKEKDSFNLLVTINQQYKNTPRENRQDWLKNNKEYRPISDIYDALSRGRFQRDGISTYGHGTSYYKKDSSVNAEIFTHLATLKTLKPNVYDMFKKDYPEIVEPFEKIITKSTQYLEEKYGK